MFEQFPYTNFHELNLDWIIKKVQEAYGPDNPPTNVVLSVDGQTGNVQVFPNAIVRLPDVSAGTWNIHRLANGTSRGIQFTPNGAERIEGTNRYKLYDETNIPVKSVNGLTGDVELFTDALIRLPDILDGTWNVRRTANGVSRGIQFTPNGTVRIEGTNRLLMYDSSNLPKTVNDRDVPIMEIALPSDTTTWGFTRQLEDGSNTTIYLQKSGDSVKAYISYISADDQTSVTLPLLTTADIPSSSGVVSINGQTGVVTLDGTQIYTYPNSNITINQALAELTNALNAVEDAIAIVANGNTHGTIASGQFVYVKNHASLTDGLYRATTAIATNDTLSTANLTADGTGGLNALNTEFTNRQKWTEIVNPVVEQDIQIDRKYNEVMVDCTFPAGQNLLFIVGVPPSGFVRQDGGFYYTNTANAAGAVTVTSSHVVKIFTPYYAGAQSSYSAIKLFAR